MRQRSVDVRPVFLQPRQHAPVRTAYEKSVRGFAHLENRDAERFVSVGIGEFENLPHEAPHASFGFFRESRRQRVRAGAFEGPWSVGVSGVSFDRVGRGNPESEPCVKFFDRRFVPHGAFAKALGVLRKFSAHVHPFGSRKSAHVFFKRIPKTPARVTPVEDVFAEYRLSGIVDVSFEAPFPQTFRVQESDVVGKARRFFVEGAEPETRALGSRNQSGFRYAGFVSGRRAGDLSADFSEFELSEGFHVPFEFHPKRSRIEGVEKDPLSKYPFRTSPGLISFQAPVSELRAGKETFGRLPDAVGIGHGDAEFGEQIGNGDALAAVAHQTVGKHSRMTGEPSSGVPRGNFSEPFRIRVDLVPKIAGFCGRGEDLFSVDAFPEFVFVSIVTPFHKPLGREVADVVGQCRPFFVERSKPGADVFRTDAVVSGFLDPVGEPRTVPGNPSSDRFHRFVRHSARVFEEFYPEATLVEEARKQDVLSVDASSGVRVDVSFHAPFLETGFV